MSARLVLRLLLAFALVFGGSAAQLHALSHAQSDLAAAGGGPVESHEAPEPLKHSTDQCLLAHVLDGTGVGTGALLIAEDVSRHIATVADVRRGESPAAAFLSRAPPVPVQNSW